MRHIPLSQRIVGLKPVNSNAHSDPGEPIPCETMGLGGGDAGTYKTDFSGSCILIAAFIRLNQPGEQ
jgi:hypothetical protein